MDKESVEPLEGLLDSVRDIDGFPIGEDEDILALSDPPFYTACPNPYIKQFIEEDSKPYNPDNDDYHREPFVGDVSEGKNNPVYNAHTYHTKVPYKAIIKFIKHYTEPGDIVFDGFCGTGMTGIAATIIGRKAILNDLSPIASFISNNYNNAINPYLFEKNAREILKDVSRECGWMYKTNHTKKAVNTRTKEHHNILTNNEDIYGSINYTVWSEVYICPYCKNEYIYWDVAIDKNNISKEEYTCPHCNASLKKNNSKRATTDFYDSSLDKKNKKVKQVPVLINYSIGGKRFEKKPDKDDLELIERIKHSEIPYWYPNKPMMEKGNNWGDTWRAGVHFGITNVHHFYTKRNLWVASCILTKINTLKDCKDVKNSLKLLLTSFVDRHIVKRNRWYKGGPTRPLSNTLYMPSLFCEVNVLDIYKKKMKDIKKALIELKNVKKRRTIISTQSLTDFSTIPSSSIDYCFTDPPFGDNIIYSELNFIWESWLNVLTNNKKEAIISNQQEKKLEEYTELMNNSFKEIYRILKPNRWITVEFHNSKAVVWNSIQEALTRAGFVIAQVSVLDKKHGTVCQGLNVGSVKNDLIINAYKPKMEFSERFLKKAGEGMEVDFVTQQLEHLPVKPNIERTEKMLYSKMLAHYVENGFKIKYDSTKFYKLLSANFVELDGYWFIDSQVKEYNEWKSGLSLDQIKEVLDGQQVLFVSDEKSALAWLYNLLHQPRTYSEIYTAYQQVATTTEDKIPELRDLLDNNFILEEGKHRRPVSREEREEINKNREKELDRAFNKLLKHAKEQKGKIRNIRQEALVHGFTKCYQEGRYQDILTVADRLYASTLESSGDIMDFVDIARIKTSGEKEVENYKG